MILSNKMYLLVIGEKEEDGFEIYAFSTKQKARDWINDYFKNSIMPDYYIYEVEKIDPQLGDTSSVIAL